MIFFPMGIILLSAQIISYEHKNNTWQLIETQPVSKLHIFLAKYIKLLIHIVVLIATLFILLLLERTVVFYVLNLEERHFYLDLNLAKIAQMGLNMFFASLSFVATLLCLHINIKKTNLISTLALILILGYTVTKVFQIQFSPLIPITPIDKAAGKVSEIGEWITFYSRLSLVQSFFILCIGYFFYNYKYFKKYFFKQTKALVTFIIILIIGSVVCFWLQMPRTQKSYGKSIIAGKVVMDVPISQLAIMDYDNNAIITIPINSDGTFYVNFDTVNIPKTNYQFGFPNENILISNSNYSNSYIFLSNGDSVFANIKFINNATSIVFSGDRRAESQFGTNNFRNLNEIHTIILNDKIELSSKLIIDLLENAIKTDLKRIMGQTTIDGFKLSQDVQEQNTFILYLQALNIWQNYRLQHSNSTDSMNDPSFIIDMKNKINLNDLSLVPFDVFKTYLYTTLNDGNPQIKDINRLDLVSKLAPSPLRNMMYVDASIKILKNQAINDTIALQIAYNAKQSIDQSHLIIQLDNEINARKSKMNKDALPNFEFEDIEGKKQSLQQFLGKYVIIDVWASWCAPCLYNAPYFSDFADKYKDKNIQFVSISTDKNISAWKAKKSTNSNIVNWITDFKDPFSQHFVIKSIPRLILISPEGKPLSHEMPMPMSQNFEVV